MRKIRNNIRKRRFIPSILVLTLWTLVLLVNPTQLNGATNNDIVIRYQDNIIAQVVNNYVRILKLLPSLADGNHSKYIQKNTSSNVLNTIKNIGNSKINTDNGECLIRYKLPKDFNKKINQSYFQPYMCYTKVTNRSSSAWRVVHDPKNAYTDENGFRRYKTTDDQFTIDNEDDYIIALGTYYTERCGAGARYLIVTSTGMYTAITGDEKSNMHTDERNMFSSHGNGKYAAVIEWIVDGKSKRVPKEIIYHGTVTKGPIEELQGDILFIYKIV